MKSRSEVSKAQISLAHRGESEPFFLRFVGFKVFVLGLSGLFRQSLEAEFSEVRELGRCLRYIREA
jgi:hypothetical protein